MSCIFRSDEERQVFLTQVDHVFLAIRGDAKFSSIYQQSFTPPNSVLREIEVRLTEVRARAMSTTVTTEADGRDDYDCLERFDYQRWTEKGGPLRGTHSTEGTSFTLHLSEESVLKVFELICCSPEASETVTSVALSALIALAELESFFTPKGVEAVIEIAYKTRSEITDMRAFEVLLYRINVLLLACVQHPNAANCNEKLYITVLNHVLTTYFEASSSPLLRRTAEAAVETTVRVFFERQMSRADSSEGAALVEFVGQMVRGEILGFQSDGNHITKNDPEVLESLQKAQRNSSEVFGEVPAIQLAGLRLATTIVTLLLKQLRTEEGRHRISNVLVSAVQDVLARALLIAGVKCDHVVVLSEVVHVTKLFSNAKLSFLLRKCTTF
ncbi:hypothetical protein ADEAN_000241800 [Angomonas deanei]|uniref:Uncharacterized protein n=1 Tax=Angomonas deanei TaxID=59799 RepID=A0A7G2C640_9TRYP|nr:hypothetical protein ADEAN_000241800 [Angomonas deanei]